jgi:hypothetical protein
LLVGAENAFLAVARREFRAYVHPPHEMIAVVARAGLTHTPVHRGWVWQAEGFARPSV